VLRGPLDAGGAALERHRQVGERGVLAQRPVEHAQQRCRRVQVAAAGEAAQLARVGVAVDLLRRRRGPHLRQPLDRRLGGVGRDGRAVDRADRGADDQVGLDAVLQQRAEHADLGGAQHPAATEHECRGSRRGRRHAAHPRTAALMSRSAQSSTVDDVGYATRFRVRVGGIQPIPVVPVF
jgi:hypothetical protein